MVFQTTWPQTLFSDRVQTGTNTIQIRIRLNQTNPDSNRVNQNICIQILSTEENRKQTSPVSVGVDKRIPDSDRLDRRSPVSHRVDQNNPVSDKLDQLNPHSNRVD